MAASGITRQDLLDAAHQAGHELSGRQLSDWISRGLLTNATIDEGEEEAEGRWHPAQKDLLLNLLAKRQTVTTLAPLYNIPVFIWLHWSDFNSYVKVDQIRRALGSWIDQSSTAGSVEGYSDEDFQNAREAYLDAVQGSFESPQNLDVRQELASDACLNLLTHLSHEDRSDP